jgi:hypothetical protein
MMLQDFEHRLENVEGQQHPDTFEPRCDDMSDTKRDREKKADWQARHRPRSDHVRQGLT